jgi:lipopolysaccharide transport system ATP-binding protein
MSAPAISVTNLSKQFQIGDLASKFDYYTFRDAIVNTVSAPFRRLTRLRGADKAAEMMWALRDVEFFVQPGEVIGIIGHNGAGKSTLLKILSRITEPTTGRLEIRGRVASLLEVGTGFHPELTGRENTYLNGAILGMTKREIERNFDEIVAFAEVERFIDTPVKRYSTGMYMRLAFAVAAHLNPEVLVIDEVLSVGDAAFQKKCLGKMQDVGSSGRTVLFVSHNMGMINTLCQRAILLKGGRVASDGAASDVVQHYVQAMETDGDIEGEVHFPIISSLPSQILSARLVDTDGNTTNRFDTMSPITIELTYTVRDGDAGLLVAAAVMRNGEVLFTTWDTDNSPERRGPRDAGTFRGRVRVPAPLLRAGRYHLKVGIGIANVKAIHDPDRLLPFDVVEDTVGTSLLSYGPTQPGMLVMPLDWQCSRES